MALPVVFSVTDSSQVGEARRAAVRLASTAGLDEQQSGKLAIIATELANNLHRYGQQGQLLLQDLRTSRGPAVEIVSIDSGPGMANIDRCLEDGFSTGGTPGNGLGAVKRLSSEFDIFSAAPGGTVILARVFAAPLPAGSRPSRVSWGAVSVCAPGEEVCGDAWRLAERDGGVSLLIADGLGHGPLAGDAAQAVARAFDAASFAGPKPLLEAGHKQASGSRGAAVAVAELNFASGIARFAGVGNISGTLITNGRSRGLASHGGIVGVQVRKVQEFESPITGGGLLVMHSDGLQSRWSLDRYPGLAQQHPGVIAGVLFRDYKRGADDLTVLVVRFQA